MSQEFCIRGADQWAKHAGLPLYSELLAKHRAIEAVIPKNGLGIDDAAWRLGYADRVMLSHVNPFSAFDNSSQFQAWLAGYAAANFAIAQGD